MLIMLKLLTLLLLSVAHTLSISAPHPGQISQLTLRIHGQVGQHQQEIQKYSFSDDQKKTRMSCVLNTTGTLDEGNYTYVVHFYINNDDKMIRTVNLQPRSTANVSRTFNLHKYDREVTCRAFREGEHFYDPLITRVHLEYRPPYERARYDVPFNSSQTIPEVYPKVVKVSSAQSVVFSCAARGPKLALLTWNQMKGNERVLLKMEIKTIWVAAQTMYYTKFFTDSDHDTEMFCAVRYFLEGRLSDEVASERVHISLIGDRPVTMEAAATQAVATQTVATQTVATQTVATQTVATQTVATQAVARVHSNDDCRHWVWLGINGGILLVSLIMMTGLIVAMLRYRKKVKEFERDEHLRTRPPMTVPYDQKPFGMSKYMEEHLAMPPENTYEQVYGHGAGLKRPKLRLFH